MRPGFEGEVGLGPGQDVTAWGYRLVEGLVAAVSPIEQHEGSGPDRLQQNPTRPLFAGMARTDKGADHGIGAALSEVDALDLGVGRRTARTLEAAKGLLILGGIGNGFDGAIRRFGPKRVGVNPLDRLSVALGAGR
jgi:hypothetical protein